MKTIFSLLDRFKSIGLPDETVRRATVKVLKEVCGVHVDITDVIVKRGVVSLSIEPHMRSELHIKKRAVMAALLSELGKSAPKDVR